MYSDLIDTAETILSFNSVVTFPVLQLIEALKRIGTSMMHKNRTTNGIKAQFLFQSLGVIQFAKYLSPK